MPLIPALPPAHVEIRPLWGPEATVSAEGIEGRKMEEEIQHVLCHWQKRWEETLAEPQLEGESYRHVPLEDAGTIRVRYTRVESLAPRKFTFDDDES